MLFRSAVTASVTAAALPQARPRARRPTLEADLRTVATSSIVHGRSRRPLCSRRPPTPTRELRAGPLVSPCRRCPRLRCSKSKRPLLALLQRSPPRQLRRMLPRLMALKLTAPGRSSCPRCELFSRRRRLLHQRPLLPGARQSSAARTVDPASD